MKTSTVSTPHRPGLRHCRLICLTLGLLVVVPGAVQAQVVTPTLSLSLAPESIGAGSCTELTFTLDNPLGVVATGVAFSLDLPAGVVLATPANPVADCDATVDALDGGTKITLSGGRVSARSSCTLRVGITSSVDGSFALTSSSLTTSAGSSGPASIDLTVDAFSRPGFTKSFSPDTINFGNRSTLPYTIDNRNEVTVADLNFSDTLPPGLLIANPSNVSTTCDNAVITATPETNTISLAASQLGSPMLAPGSCPISVGVVGTTVGSNSSISSDLTFLDGQFQSHSAGRACALLEVLSLGTLQLTKSFLDDPAAPGETATIEFTLTNLDRANTITNTSATSPLSEISFTDSLSAIAPSTNAILPPSPDPPCGPSSSLSVVSAGVEEVILSLTGGTLAPGQSCTFSVVLELTVRPRSSAPAARAMPAPTSSGDCTSRPWRVCR